MSRAFVLFPLLLSGCIRLLAAPIPMKAETDSLQGEARARCLLVFLPGVADRALTFREQGFVDELRKRNLSVDVVSADSTIGYYLRGVDARRLEQDVVWPARTRGYEQVWMAGVSMGGFGTLHYASMFPGSLDGIFALAPHLGEETVLQTIRDAGGLRRWQPPARDPFVPQNHTEATWSWLHAVTVDKRPGPLVYLGYGDWDPVVGQAGLLDAALPRAQVLHVAGGHSWGTWRQLWGQFLDHSEFTHRCAGPTVAAR